MSCFYISSNIFARHVCFLRNTYIVLCINLWKTFIATKFNFKRNYLLIEFQELSLVIFKKLLQWSTFTAVFLVSKGTTTKNILSENMIHLATKHESINEIRRRTGLIGDNNIIIVNSSIWLGYFQMNILLLFLRISFRPKLPVISGYCRVYIINMLSVTTIWRVDGCD